MDSSARPPRRKAYLKQDKTGRSAGRRRRKNPPSGPTQCGIDEWVWQPVEMLMGEAWREISINARRVVERLMIEHCAQGATSNGELCVSYEQFEEHGASYNHIAAAISEAEAAGAIVARRQGKQAGRNSPTFYRLTWLGGWNASGEMIPPTNDWKSRTAADVKRARSQRKLATKRRCASR